MNKRYNIPSYMKNVKRSGRKLLKDQVGRLMPTLNSTIVSNRDAFDEIRRFNKESKSQINYIKNQRGDIFGPLKDFIHNAKQDLKTGKFYNEERTMEATGMDDMLDGFGDINDEEFIDDSEIESVRITSKFDKYLKSNGSSLMNGRALSNSLNEVNISNTDYMVSVSSINHNRLMALSVKNHMEQMKQLKNIEDIGMSMMKFNEEVVTDAIQRRDAFYEEILSETRELKELIKSQTDLTMSRFKSGSSGFKSTSTFERIFGSNDTLDLKEYFKQIKKNVGNQMPIGFDQIKMLSGGLTANPILSILNFLTPQLLPNDIKKKLKDADKTIAGEFAKYFLKLNNLKRNGKTDIGRLIGEIFGIDLSTYNKPNLGMYRDQDLTLELEQKKAKAITEVIPSYLSEILKSMTGKDKMYDYSRGIFVDKKKRRKEIEQEWINERASEMYETRSTFNRILSKANLNTSQYSYMEDEIDKFLEYITRSDKPFDPNMSYSELRRRGLKLNGGEKSYRYIQSMYKQFTRAQRGTAAREQLASLGKRVGVLGRWNERYQETGESHLFNGIDREEARTDGRYRLRKNIKRSKNPSIQDLYDIDPDEFMEQIAENLSEREIAARQKAMREAMRKESDPNYRKAEKSKLTQKADNLFDKFSGVKSLNELLWGDDEDENSRGIFSPLRDAIEDLIGRGSRSKAAGKVKGAYDKVENVIKDKLDDIFDVNDNIPGSPDYRSDPSRIRDVARKRYRRRGGLRDPIQTLTENLERGIYSTQLDTIISLLSGGFGFTDRSGNPIMPESPNTGGGSGTSTKKNNKDKRIQEKVNDAINNKFNEARSSIDSSVLNNINDRFVMDALAGQNDLLFDDELDIVNSNVIDLGDVTRRRLRRDIYKKYKRGYYRSGNIGRNIIDDKDVIEKKLRRDLYRKYRSGNYKSGNIGRGQSTRDPIDEYRYYKLLGAPDWYSKVFGSNKDENQEKHDWKELPRKERLENKMLQTMLKLKFDIDLSVLSADEMKEFKEWSRKNGMKFLDEKFGDKPIIGSAISKIKDSGSIFGSGGKFDFSKLSERIRNEITLRGIGKGRGGLIGLALGSMLLGNPLLGAIAGMTFAKKSDKQKQLEDEMGGSPFKPGRSALKYSVITTLLGLGPMPGILLGALFPQKKKSAKDDKEEKDNIWNRFMAGSSKKGRVIGGLAGLALGGLPGMLIGGLAGGKLIGRRKKTDKNDDAIRYKVVTDPETGEEIIVERTPEEQKAARKAIKEEEKERKRRKTAKGTIFDMFTGGGKGRAAAFGGIAGLALGGLPGLLIGSLSGGIAGTRRSKLNRERTGGILAKQGLWKSSVIGALIGNALMGPLIGPWIGGIAGSLLARQKDQKFWRYDEYGNRVSRKEAKLRKKRFKNEYKYNQDEELYRYDMWLYNKAVESGDYDGPPPSIYDDEYQITRDQNGRKIRSFRNIIKNPKAAFNRYREERTRRREIIDRENKLRDQNEKPLTKAKHSLEGLELFKMNKFEGALKGAQTATAFGVPGGPLVGALAGFLMSGKKDKTPDGSSRQKALWVKDANSPTEKEERKIQRENKNIVKDIVRADEGYGDSSAEEKAAEEFEDTVNNSDSNQVQKRKIDTITNVTTTLKSGNGITTVTNGNKKSSLWDTIMSLLTGAAGGSLVAGVATIIGSALKSLLPGLLTYGAGSLLENYAQDLKDQGAGGHNTINQYGDASFANDTDFFGESGGLLKNAGAGMFMTAPRLFYNRMAKRNGRTPMKSAGIASSFAMGLTGLDSSDYYSSEAQAYADRGDTTSAEANNIQSAYYNTRATSSFVTAGARAVKSFGNFAMRNGDKLLKGIGSSNKIISKICSVVADVLTNPKITKLFKISADLSEGAIRNTIGKVLLKIISSASGKIPQLLAKIVSKLGLSATGVGTIVVVAYEVFTFIRGFNNAYNDLELSNSIKVPARIRVVNGIMYVIDDLLCGLLDISGMRDMLTSVVTSLVCNDEQEALIKQSQNLAKSDYERFLQENDLSREGFTMQQYQNLTNKTIWGHVKSLFGGESLEDYTKGTEKNEEMRSKYGGYTTESTGVYTPVDSTGTSTETTAEDMFAFKTGSSSDSDPMNSTYGTNMLLAEIRDTLQANSGGQSYIVQNNQKTWNISDGALNSGTLGTSEMLNTLSGGRGSNLRRSKIIKRNNGKIINIGSSNNKFRRFGGRGSTISGHFNRFSARGTDDASKVVNKMLSLEGKYSYAYGAVPSGDSGSTDCSGLQQYVYKSALGIDIGRDTNAQMQSGTLVHSGSSPDTSKLLPGDLVFYNDHVEMYIGNGQVMGIGSGTGPSKRSINYRSDYIESRRYCDGGTNVNISSNGTNTSFISTNSFTNSGSSTTSSKDLIMQRARKPRITTETSNDTPEETIIKVMNNEGMQKILQSAYENAEGFLYDPEIVNNNSIKIQNKEETSQTFGQKIISGIKSGAKATFGAIAKGASWLWDKAKSIGSKIKEGATWIWNKFTGGRGSSDGSDGIISDPDYYNQQDPRWGNMSFGRYDNHRDTVADGGCGPTTAATVIQKLTGQTVTPAETSRFALSKGYKVDDGGTTPDYFNAIGSKYGVGFDQSEPGSPETISNLQQGKPVIFLGHDSTGTSPFGNDSHYVVGTGMDRHGNISILDPKNSSNNRVYNINDIAMNSMQSIVPNVSGGRGRIHNRRSRISSRRTTNTYNSALTRTNNYINRYKRKNKFFGGRGGEMPTIRQNLLPDSLSVGEPRCFAKGRPTKADTADPAEVTGYAYSEHGHNGVAYIVLHYTGAGGNDENTTYGGASGAWAGMGTSSAHYVVHPTYVEQCVQLSDTAFHCRGVDGKGPLYYKCFNENAIGIEQTTRDGTTIGADTLENSRKLVSWLMAEYDIPLDHVVRHCDVTTKLCPRQFCGSSANEKAWNDWKATLTPKEYNPNYTGNYKGTASGSSSGSSQSNPALQDHDGFYAPELIHGFPYYAQHDPRWANKSYGSGTMASSACGPSAMAMVLTSYGISIDPPMAADYSVSHGHRVEGQGTAYTFYADIGRANGLTVDEFTDFSKAENYLKSNIPVIASMGPGNFTSASHLIVLSGINNGNILVSDSSYNSRLPIPDGKDRSQKEWSPSIIKSEANRFWAVSKNGKGSIGSVGTNSSSGGSFSSSSSSGSASSQGNRLLNKLSWIMDTIGGAFSNPISGIINTIHSAWDNSGSTSNTTSSSSSSSSGSYGVAGAASTGNGANRSLPGEYADTSNIHSHMAWQMVNSGYGSMQGALKQNAGMSFDSDGLGRIGDRYTVAVKPYFGSPGDYIDVYQEDGSVIPGIIADEKGFENGSTGKAMYVHSDGSVLEFVVDQNAGFAGYNGNKTVNDIHPEWNKKIKSIQSVGNYWGLSPAGGEEYSNSAASQGSVYSARFNEVINAAKAKGGGRGSGNLSLDDLLKKKSNKLKIKNPFGGRGPHPDALKKGLLKNKSSSNIAIPLRISNEIPSGDYSELISNSDIRPVVKKYATITPITKNKKSYGGRGVIPIPSTAALTEALASKSNNSIINTINDAIKTSSNRSPSTNNTSSIDNLKLDEGNKISTAMLTVLKTIASTLERIEKNSAMRPTVNNVSYLPTSSNTVTDSYKNDIINSIIAGN